MKMQLPKRDLPEFVATLPIGGVEFKYRPYTVKEDKILMMAANGENTKDKLNAIRQIVENCTDLNIAEVHPTDFEWVFLQLRKVSVSPVVELVYNVKDDQCGLSEDSTKECPGKLNAHFNINDINVNSDFKMDQVATPAKTGGWIINLGETAQIHLDPVMPADSDNSLLYGMVRNIIEGDNVYPKDSFTEDEFNAYLDESVLPSELAKIMSFIGNMPTTRVKIKTTCKLCKKNFVYDAQGLIDFLI